MRDHFLAVGSDSAWLSAMQLLEDPESYDDPANANRSPPRVTVCPDDTTALTALEKDDGDSITAAIIFGFHVNPAISVEMSARGYGALDLAISLQAKRRSLPILLATPVRLDVLERFAASREKVEVINAESVQSIRAAIVKTRKGKGGRQPWAQVDIFIGVESIRFRVILADGKVVADCPISSDIRAFLEDKQKEYELWKLYVNDPVGGRRRRDGFDSLWSVGDRLHYYLVSDPLRLAIEKCLEQVSDMGDVHFRVVTDSGTFPDVPFDAIRDSGRKKFLRDLSPMARRIHLQPSETTFGANTAEPASVLSAKPLTGRLLVIQSNTGSGELRAGRHTFNGAETISFGRLPNLDLEFTSISAARAQGKCSKPETCLLETVEADSIGKLEAAVQNGPWDIVHFCGHSVRTDDREVFIVLPGQKALELTAMPMGRFAHILRKGQVRLAVLSSCESASSLGVFRLAQEGVPSVIGFRWEVETNEAVQFVTRLHKNLGEGVPLGRSYLDGLQVLTENCPAFLSAMLVVQHDPWAEPAVKAED